jgi:hypothetical protein
VRIRNTSLPRRRSPAPATRAGRPEAPAATAATQDASENLPCVLQPCAAARITAATQAAERVRVELDREMAVVAQKLLRKCCNKFTFEEAMHPADAAAAQHETAAHIEAGMMAAEHPLSQECAEHIVVESTCPLAALFCDEQAQEKAHGYLATELLRFSAYVWRKSAAHAEQVHAQRDVGE